MKIINPSVELIPDGIYYEKVAKCASICYASSEKLGGKAEKFYKGLIASGHISMLRHASYYAIVPMNGRSIDLHWRYDNCPYIEMIPKDGYYHIATNRNFLLDHQDICEYLVRGCYEVSSEEMFEKCPEIMRYTFLINTSIAVSREGNRQSPNNISEQSTRYITFNKQVEPTICKPYWIKQSAVDGIIEADLSTPEGEVVRDYVDACSNAFKTYFKLLERGMKPEEARGVLPLDTATKVIYTMSIKEWQHFFDLRLFGKTGRPHPDIKYLAVKIWQEFKDAGVDFPVPEGFDIASILI